jgi:hypothetical protein
MEIDKSIASKEKKHRSQNQQELPSYITYFAAF